MTRGILAAAGYLPHRRLDRSTIVAVAGGGGGRGTRTVAGYDEDTTTMGVEAARLALRQLEGATPGTLWFSTVAPAYADKTNATAIHAALRLDATTPAFDVHGSIRSALGALRAALDGTGMQLVVSADLRSGLAGGPDEAAFGDGAAALVVGDGTVPASASAGGAADRAASQRDAGPDPAFCDSSSPAGTSAGGDPAGAPPLLAELLGSGSATAELLDRWRAPGEARSRVWEERFGEARYVPLAEAAWDDALKAAGVVADQVDRVIVTGPHARACHAAATRLGVGDRLVDDLTDRVGNTGAAHPALLLAAVLDQATSGQVVASVTLADGADVLLFRTTDAVAGRCPTRPVARQVAAGAPVDYGTYLRWRGLLPVEPPRRPDPTRPSASAAGRSTAWKFGFVGSATDDGTVHLPPQPGDPAVAPMADATGRIATFTVDRLAHSPSPPVVFAVVDFDGGGRLPVELTDVAVDEVRIGAPVELTFRRLFTVDGIHNYFWKARLVAGGDG